MAASKQPWRSYDPRFEISNLDYPGIHVHIISNSLRGNGGLHTTSEVMTPDLKLATLITPVSMCTLPPTASKAITASEAMASSKQPQI